MLTIIGLGNPIPEYSKTRHNIGEHIISTIVNSEEIDMVSKKLFEALIGKGDLSGTPVTFVLPQTYMNDSGKTIHKLFGKTSPDAEHKELIVIHDDIDMPIGTVKMTYDRGSAGHKGLDSIDNTLKTTKYYRIKIGIIPTDEEGVMRKPNHDKMPNFVTGTFTDAEWKALQPAIKKVIETLHIFAKDGPVKAMEFANTK